MRILFLSHANAFGLSATAIAQHTAHDVCCWRKLDAGCPMLDPDVVICDQSSLFLTFEEERQMGVVSHPLRACLVLGAPKGYGGPINPDWRMLTFNNVIFTYAPMDNIHYREALTATPEEWQDFVFLPQMVGEAHFERRTAFDYQTEPFVCCQSLSAMFPKSTNAFKWAAADAGCQPRLFMGLNATDLRREREACHMAFDNMRRGSVGRSGLETMAMGIATCGLAGEPVLEAMERVGPGFPWINVHNREELRQTLVLYKADRSALQAKAEEQGRWMAEHYTLAKLAGFWVARFEEALANHGR